MSRRERSLEWWIAVVRLCAVPFAVFQVAYTSDYPERYETIAWIVTAVLAAGAVVLYPLARDNVWPRLPYAAMAFDFGVIAAYTLMFAFEPGTPTRQLLYLAIVTGAARFGMAGGIFVAIATVPVSAWFESRRSHYFHAPYRIQFVTFQAGAGVLMAMVTGWLYSRLDEQRATAVQRATEAESLRDELGRRADLLDAANRCARALSSSLDLDEAFAAFIRELRGLVPFDRVGILLAEEGTAQVIANAGEHIDDIYPTGSRLDLGGTLIEEVVASGQTVYREDMSDSRYVEEPQLVAAGMHARVAAPLVAGTRAVGILSLLRK